MSDETRPVLVRFLDELEAIGEVHEEVYDTDVRERLAERIESVFVSREAAPAASDELGMFSDEANSRVAAALDRFLVDMSAAAASIDDPGARRDSVWDAEATSTSGLTVDEFLGWP